MLIRRAEIFWLLGCRKETKAMMITGRNCGTKAAKKDDNCDEIRVRFAPSPTGFVHLGGLRTAFYNYLFARRHPKGKFVLRIEDTDRDRIVDGSLPHIIDTLTWAGLTPDEGPGQFGGPHGPYIQSERTEIYREMIERLLQTGAAYRCFCTSKRLELLRREAAKNRETIRYDNRCRSLGGDEIRANMAADKPYTIRLRLREGPITIEDMVYGSVTYDLSRVEGDPILMKSDHVPTYHFANVVDDYAMRISHVLRGAEWLVSTPKHMMLYEAFGWRAPRYAHLPLIVNPDGSKLSKRHDHIRVDAFRSAGYYASTVLNYLTQMGGGFGAELDTAANDRLYSIDQLAAAFRLHAVNQNNCRIDTDKIRLLNRIAIKRKCCDDMSELIEDLRRLLAQAADQNDNREAVLCDVAYIRRVIEWSWDRIYSLNELIGDEQFAFVWSIPRYTWWPQLASIKMDCTNKKSIIHMLQSTIDAIGKLDHVKFESIETILDLLRDLHRRNFHQNQDDQAEEQEIKFATYMRLLRYALTNQKVGSPVAQTIRLLGQRRSIEYLQSAIEYVANVDQPDTTKL